MDYKQLNDINRKKMNGICNAYIKMQWQDSNLIDILLGKLPKLRSVDNKTEIKELVEKLEIKLDKYNIFSTDKKKFVKEIKELVEEIQIKQPYWYGITVNSIEECIKMHKFCLISGEGGIGKSYFIKCLEEKLENNNIKHLCIYGKFEKNLENIDIDELIRVAEEQSFVFIVDAVNEMSLKSDTDLVNLLKTLNSVWGMRIIVTYRTGTISSDLIRKINEIAEIHYRFPGVSYESALAQLARIPVIDVYKYEDILYSNNPMLLNMLCTVLADEKVVEQTEKGISTITYILEQYIKKGLKNKQFWIDTKNISRWMYENNQKRIDSTSLHQIVDKPDLYIASLEQIGFITEFTSEEETYYLFAIDTLTDFLLARNIWNDFDNMSTEQRINCINDKLEKFYGSEEVFLLALFDKYAPNYKYIHEILIATKLIKHLTYETLLKIKFDNQDVDTFLKYFVPSNKNELLLYFGGYTDKPFNCVNYLNEYYLNSINAQTNEISKLLSGNYIAGRIIERLKNILYFVAVQEEQKQRLDEAFYFALWCSSAPNMDVRCLARKLLYDVTQKDKTYVNVLIKLYFQILDDYIRETIIYVICMSQKDNEEIKSFIELLISDKQFLNAKSIKRISTFRQNPYEYIGWEKNNLYLYDSTSKISEDLSSLFCYVDIYEKNLLNFRYWGKDHIDMHYKFLDIDKNEIMKWNLFLEEKFDCIKGEGECNGSLSFEEKVNNFWNKDYSGKLLDEKSFFKSFEIIIKVIFKKYGLSYSKQERIHYRERNFENSVLKKAVCVAQDIFYGSMMCNYYTDEFATYNNMQNSIGYEVYDPLEYDEDINLTTPIPTYQEVVEKLGDVIISRLYLPKGVDVEWVKDISKTEENLLKMGEPIHLKKQDWILIAGNLFLHEGETEKRLWQEHYGYWCCTSEYESIKGDGKDRYLTIELDDYIGNLDEYKDCTARPYLCKKVPMINNSTDVFEETYLILPPAELINKLNLKVCKSNMTWINDDGDVVIYCNNNKRSYYKDFIGGTVFMRKDVYEEYVHTNFFKIFAFSEKWTPATGYADETSMHFEIIDGNIVKKYYNYLDNHTEQNENVTDGQKDCEKCPYGFGSDKVDYSKLEEILKVYGLHSDEL